SHRSSRRPRARAAPSKLRSHRSRPESPNVDTRSCDSERHLHGTLYSVVNPTSSSGVAESAPAGADPAGAESLVDRSLEAGPVSSLSVVVVSSLSVAPVGDSAGCVFLAHPTAITINDTTASTFLNFIESSRPWVTTLYRTLPADGTAQLREMRAGA